MKLFFREFYFYKIVSLSILIFVQLLFFYNCKKSTPENQEIVLPTAPKGGDFVLESPEGKLSTKSLRGKVVLLYFGFTSCPDVCPTSLSLLSTAFKSMTVSDLKNVLVLFITVDPERDSLKILKQYTAYFHENIIPLSGTIEEIQSVAKMYGVTFRKQNIASGMGYTVDHTASTFILNKDGKFVKTLAHATPANEVKNTIQDLLK